MKASPFKDDDDADGPQTHITIFQPPMPGAVKLLLERLEYTSDRLFHLASMLEREYHGGMAGELREANAAFSRILFGYEFANEEEEVVE